MKPDTTNNSWKINLFLVTTIAAVTAGLMTLYNRYQDAKKSQDVRAQQDAETQTHPVQTHQGRPAPRPFQAPQDRRPEVEKKSFPMNFRRIPVEILLSYADRAPLVKVTAQPNTNPKPNENALPVTQTESPQPISPRGELPGAGAARLFDSRSSSCSVLSSRVPSVEEDLDKPRTPDNSEARITAEEQEKRGAGMFAEIVKTAAPAQNSWLPWPFRN